ncbi:hypothetical protein B0O79_3759 [Flavobacteriaceae bacterium MAR_2009_75]|nr:hypothetical protein B0O79_3759 [Flavobacteriaceae bacterium MAR_2009_75]
MTAFDIGLILSKKSFLDELNQVQVTLLRSTIL